MKETGIIMSGDHPTKIIDGTKTQTRRTYGLEKLNEFPYYWELAPTGYDGEKKAWLFWQKNTGDGIYIKCPYGHIGDRLWIKETWRISDFDNEGGQFSIEYKAGGKQNNLCTTDDIIKKYWVPNAIPEDMYIWRPSIFMHKWASRIKRDITGLRPERLQDITEADAIAEGCYSDAIVVETPEGKDYTGLYAADKYWILWDSLNGKKYTWSGNYWVWVINF